MIKRNGSTFRNLLIAVVLVALVYFIYLYNGVQSQLRKSEIVSEKLKRDRETLSSQLNDISLEKENVKEKYQKERLEIMSKLTDIQNKYKMLQSQHQDMETDYSRIQQKLDKFSEDSKQKDANRNQEFMQLKQEKEMEIVKLKDQNANMFRENEQYKAELMNLKQQLQQQQQETFDGWNQVGQLKKTVELLQLSLQREKSASEILRQQLHLAQAMNMKNIGNNQVDTGGNIGAGNLQFMPHNMQQPLHQQQQLLQQQQQQQQQQKILDPQQQQQLLQKQPGLLNDLQNGNALGRILHQPPNNQFGLGQAQQAQMANAGNLPKIKDTNNGLPGKQEVPLDQEHFQIPPANVDHDAAGNVKANNGKDLDLQKQEVEQRKQQHENEHNQVQPPIDNEDLEKSLNEENKNELDEEEVEREHIFGMLNRGRHAKRNEPFEAEHPIVPPAFQNDGKALNEPQHPPLRVNVEDKLAGRDSANENHQFLEDKIPQEMMIGQNLEDIKDGGDQLKKSHRGNKRQKMNRNHGFNNALLADEKELQVQHPNNLDGGNKKSQGLNNDDQYYDEEEDDTYQ